MISIRLVLRKKKNKEGKYPLAIRITKDRKSSFLHLGFYLEVNQWDEKNQKIKKSHPNSTRLNNLIAKKLSEANDKYLELESADSVVTAKTIQKKVKKKSSNNSWKELSQSYLDNQEKSGKISTFLADRTRVKHFNSFLQNQDISFQEITELLIKQFQAYLKGELHLSERSITNNLIVIRSIYNLAIREGLVDQKHYPFGKEKVKVKIPQSIKLGLTQEEVGKVESLELEKDSPIWNARNAWLISFYFAGMRVSDVLRMKWSDLNDNRLQYKMGKNQKPGTLKIPPKALQIFDQYKNHQESDSDFIFSELKKANQDDPKDVNRKIGTAVKKFNKYLAQIAKKAKIDKKITMHIARHTFGNISGDKIPIQMLQKLYRHTSITTTINYQSNFIFKDADDALDSVLDF